MIDISVLKLLLNKENYKEHRGSLLVTDFSKELQSVIRTMDAWYLDEDHPSLTVDDLSNLYFTTNRKDVDFYSGVFDTIRGNTSGAESTRALIGALRRTRLLRELALDAYDSSEGRKKIEDVIAKFEQLKETPDGTDDDDEAAEFVSCDLESLLTKTRTTPGLRWRLDSLNVRLGSLRQGNFGFVFARPETGKTTFLASEVSFMCSQVSRPVLWINNEQVGEEVMLRFYQAALGIDQVQLHADIVGNRKRFREATKENLLLKDSASIHWRKIEEACAKHSPSLIVFDQIDKIKGFDNDREDLRLGSIYIWARELAKSYCPVIGICQSDGTGEGQRWLSMANVANAKTSKQAEADWILGIGKVNEPGYDNLRFLHLSKNKLPGDMDTNPNLRHDRWETLIEANIGRFRDL